MCKITMFYIRKRILFFGIEKEFTVLNKGGGGGISILNFSAIFYPVYGFIILCRCFNTICVKLQCFTYEKEYFFF